MIRLLACRPEKVAAEPAGDGIWRVRLVVENQGWLPTSGTQKAVDQGAVGGVRTEPALPGSEDPEVRQHSRTV